MSKVNTKRLFLSIMILVVIIVAIVFAIKFIFNKDGNGEDPISQNETQMVNEFVDESGNKMDEATLKTTKDAIVRAFKAIPVETLGLTADISEARLVFNQGITTIAEVECFVFNVYSQENDVLKNIGTFAMSRDTNTVFKFNNESLEYDKIK